MSRRWALLVIACCSSWCSAQAATPQPRALRVGIGQDVVTLDWTRSINEVDLPLLLNLQDTLLKLSPRGQALPMLVEKWTVSKDGLVYTLKLRRKVRWSDGTEFTAQHARDGLIRLIAPYTSSPFASLAFDIVGAERFSEGKTSDADTVGVRAIDTTTLEIKLSRVSPNWLVTLTHPATAPVRLDLIQKLGPAWTKPGNLVVLGPFQLDSHLIGKKLSLRKNATYWNAASVWFNAMEFEVMTPDEALAAVQSGAAHLVLDPAPSLRTKFFGKPEYRSLPSLRVKRLSLNLKQYPLTDARVRESIVRAIDRRSLPVALGRGYVPATSFAPPGLLGHSTGAGPRFDVIAARRIMREGKLISAGMKFKLLVPAFDENTEENLETGRWLKEQLERNLSIVVETEAVTDAKSWPVVTRSPGFAFVIHDRRPNLPDAYHYYEAYASTSRSNTPWEDVGYERLLAAARSAQAAKMAAAYRAVDDYLTQRHSVMLPLYYAPDAAIVSRRIEGFAIDPFNYKRLDTTRLRP